MKRIVFALLLASACNKPTEDDCRKALLNMQHLMGTETADSSDAKLQGEVRRCRGGSTKESVACAIKANSMDDLKKCDFYKVPDHPAGSAAGGSATGSATGSGH